jgi:hypothetical protein
VSCPVALGGKAIGSRGIALFGARKCKDEETDVFFLDKRELGTLSMVWDNKGVHRHIDRDQSNSFISI